MKTMTIKRVWSDMASFRVPSGLSRLEDADIQVQPALADLLVELRHQAGRGELPHDLALAVDPLALEAKDLGHGDDVALDPVDLLDADDPAVTVFVALELDDQVERGRDLRAQRPAREVDARHGDHALDSGQGIAGCVRMDGGQRAVVPGVHGLEHIQRFGPADLADHDAVRAHTQAVAHQIALGDLAAALDVGRAGLEPYDMGLLKLQLGGVFDGDDTLVRGNETGEDVEQRGLAGAGAAGDQDVESASDRRLKHATDRRGQLAELDEPFHREPIDREASNRHHGAVECQRRDDGIHAGAVRQPSVDHGRGLVDPAPDTRDDTVDDGHEMTVVVEARTRQFQPTVALDIDLARPVDQDVRDRGIGQQTLQRTQTQDLVLDLFDDPLPGLGIERQRLLIHEALARLLDLGACLGVLEVREERQIHHLDDVLQKIVFRLLLGLRKPLAEPTAQTAPTQREFVVGEAGRCAEIAGAIAEHVHRSRPQRRLRDTQGQIAREDVDASSGLA
ncbi:hypothetical protein THIOKS12210017 [Thiocapsa sp. KS1]|nr:hypothetical protein THIOKS12210017 [Thiocapsa sp. KS1]